MKRAGALFLITILCVSMFIILVPKARADQNVIVNPGFENGLSGWSTSQGSAVYSVDSSTSHSGSYSSKGVETNIGSLGRLYQDVTGLASPGNQYQISGWIKTSSVVGQVVIGLDYVASNGASPADGYVNEIGYVTGTQDWTFFQSPVFTLPPMPNDANALWFLFDFNNGAGTAWWNDVSLVSISGTTPPPPAAPTVSLSPASWALDVGESRTFTATASGGSGSYTNYQWYVNGQLVESGAQWSSYPYVFLYVGTYSVTVAVTDSSGATSAMSSNATITVNAPPSVSVAPVGPFTLEAGQFQILTASASGGTGILTYQWYLNGSPVGSDSNDYPFSHSAGLYSVTCMVTDSSSVPVTSAASNAVSLTVNQLNSATPASVSISANPDSISENPLESGTITATVLDQNGNPIQGIQVSFTTTAGVLTSPSLTDNLGQTQVTLTPNSETTSPLTVMVVASAGNVQNSATVVFEPPAFIFTITTNPKSMTVSTGQTAITTIVVSSSQTPSLTVMYSVSDPTQQLGWSLSNGAGQPPCTSTLTIYTNGGPPAPAGTYDVTVTGHVGGGITESTDFTLIITDSRGSIGTLQVVAYDKTTRNPIQNVLAQMTSAPSGQSLLSGSTDSNGQYLFQNVEAGQYTVSFSANGYQTLSASGSVNQGSSNAIDVNMVPTATTSPTPTPQATPSPTPKPTPLPTPISGPNGTPTPSPSSSPTPSSNPLSVTIQQDPEISMGTVPFSVSFTAHPSGGIGSYSVSWVITPSMSSVGTSYFGGMNSLTYVFKYSSNYVVKTTVSCSGSAETASSQVTITAIGGQFLANLGLDSGWAEYGFLGLGQQTPFIQLEHNNQPNQGLLAIGSTSVSLESNVYVNFAGPQIPSVLASALGISTPWYSIEVSDQAGGPIDTRQVVQLDMDTSALLQVTLPQGTPTSITGGNSLSLYRLNFTASAVTPRAFAQDCVYILFSIAGMAVPSDPGTMNAIVDAVTYYFASNSASTIANLPFMSSSDQSKFIQNSFGPVEQTIENLAASSISNVVIKSLADVATQGEISAAQFGYDALTLIGAFAIRAEVWDEYAIQQITPMLSVVVDPSETLNALLHMPQGDVGYSNGAWINTGNLSGFIHTDVMNNTYGFWIPVLNNSCNANLTVSSPNNDNVPYSAVVNYGNTSYKVESTANANVQIPVSVSGTTLTVKVPPQTSFPITEIIFLMAIGIVAAAVVTFFVTTRLRPKKRS